MKQAKKGLRARLQAMKPHTKYFLSAVLFLAIFALFLTWFIEYRYFINDMWSAWNFVFARFRPFIFNALLVFLILLALWGLSGRPAVSACLSWIIFTIICYINANKVIARANPLLPEDFQLAGAGGSLTKFIDPWSIVRLVLSCLLIVLMTVIFCKKLEKRLYLRNPYLENKRKSFGVRHLLAPRVVIFLLGVTVFMNVTEFARHNSGERYEDIAFLESTFTAWNQNRNYDENGFILGFLYNLQKLEVSQPDEYTDESLVEMSAEYRKLAENSNKSRLNPEKENVSLVVILNESFYDPSVEWQGKKFEDYYPHDGGEILPNLRKIQQKYPSGIMYSTDYCGGTANIEFETLTGLSNYWQNTVPYTAIVPKLDKVSSVATMLKDQGYDTLAIHPFNGGMYKRNISLVKEGFDDFITESEMDYTEHDGNSEYINDRSAYRQTIQALEKTKNNQAILLITMQNHTPYNEDTYEELKYSITGDKIDEEHRKQIATYYQSLHNSDAYLGEFIDSLEKLDKKVAVLYFGDHSAGLFDVVKENENKQVRDLARLTPYFVYTNYETEYQTRHLPTVTPNCTMNAAFNALNWQKSARYYFLDEVCSTTPILSPSYYDDSELVDSETVKKYRLLIYDILSGKNNWQE
jgi:phosphoglycerol transferase MdoB-like AlkP superfamily enzyme